MGKSENYFYFKNYCSDDLEVGRCVELNDLMKLHDIKCQGHSSYFAVGHSVFNFNLVFLKNYWVI